MQLLWMKSELFSPFWSWSVKHDVSPALVRVPSQVQSQHLAVVGGSGTHRCHWSLPNLSDTDLNAKQRKDGGCHFVQKAGFWCSSSTQLLWRATWECMCQEEESTTPPQVRKALKLWNAVLGQAVEGLIIFALQLGSRYNSNAVWFHIHWLRKLHQPSRAWGLLFLKRRSCI